MHAKFFLAGMNVQCNGAGRNLLLDNSTVSGAIMLWLIRLQSLGVWI